MPTQAKDGVVECKCGHKEAVKGCEVKSVTMSCKKKEDVPLVDSMGGILPKTNVPCPKCGNNEAYWILRQTRSADEPETRIYTCTKCGASWREY